MFAGLKFLADENIHAQVVAFLRAEGHDVNYVREMNLAGSGDDRLLTLSVLEKRVVLTHDSDFGTLAMAANHPVYGILYLRPGHFGAEYTIQTLRAVFELEHEPELPAIIVAQRHEERVKVRIRPVQREQ